MLIQHHSCTANLSFTTHHCVFYLCLKFCVPAQIDFCVHVEDMVCFPCSWLCFIYVSFEFILGLCVFTLNCCYRAYGEIKMVQISTLWTRTFSEHTLAPICWVVTDIGKSANLPISEIRITYIGKWFGFPISVNQLICRYRKFEFPKSVIDFPISINHIDIPISANHFPM